MPHLGDRDEIQVRGVRQQVDRDHAERAQHQRPGQVALGVAHLAAHERKVTPAVVGPEDRDERQPERRRLDNARCLAEMRELSPPDHERQQHEQHQRAVLRPRGEVEDE